MEQLKDLAQLGTAISHVFHKNFEDFSKVIREAYCARQKNRDLQWPPCFAEKLVRLELRQEVYNIYYNKQQRGEHAHSSTFSREQLQYNDIFQNKAGGVAVRKVLVEGDAGIGKTTLCTSISLDWAQNKRLQQFELLLLLPLRDRAVYSVKTVVQLLQLFHPNKAVCKSVADSFSQGNLGKCVLIIADGWDELKRSLHKPGSFIYELLFNDIIPSATVMITSRPSASIALHKNPNIDRFIEIAGFDIKGIIQYVKSEFPTDKAKRAQDNLLQQIKENPLIRSICHVPINCAIVCHMWRTDESLPSDMTLTDIYTKIILHFMLRAFKKIKYDLDSLNSFDYIPGDLEKNLSLLCKFAYDALVNDKFIFSDEELQEVFPEASTAIKDRHFTFGLMQSAQTFFGVGMGASFHFLHRTFQEYLAALYVVKQPEQNQIELIKPYAYASRMAMSWRFVAGLGSSGKSISSKIVPVTRHAIRKIFDLDVRVRVSCVGRTNDLVVHGICEAKGGEVKESLLEILYGDHFTFAFPRNAYDCATVAKAIEQFPQAEREGDVSEVSFKLEHCGLDEDLLANIASALFQNKGKVQVRTFLLQNNNLSDTSISTLMTLAASAFKSLKKLSLAANELGAKTIHAISENLKMSSIQHLILSYNPLGASGALALQNAVKVDTFSKLSDLQLKNCALSNSEACVSLFQVLPDHCANLKQLDISENEIDDPTSIGESLGKLLQAHQNLSEVYANETKFGDEGIKALTNVLNMDDNVTQINVLSLKKNGIHSAGISLLAKCIQLSHLVINNDLCVDGNPLKLMGAVNLASVLNTKSVSMANCQLTEFSENEKYLLVELTKLPQTQLCQELILDHNCFSGEQSKILVEFIRICPQLNSLSSVGCEITTDDLKYILSEAKCTSSLGQLETWSLQRNMINNEGCSLLIVNLESYLKKVSGIFIQRNAITNQKLLKVLEKEAREHKLCLLEVGMTNILLCFYYRNTLILCHHTNCST